MAPMTRPKAAPRDSRQRRRRPPNQTRPQTCVERSRYGSTDVRSKSAMSFGVRCRLHSRTGLLGGTSMSIDESTTVKVSKRMEAEPAHIFEILSQPKRHIEIDGSGMLRGAITDEPIAGIGDVFAM